MNMKKIRLLLVLLIFSNNLFAQSIVTEDKEIIQYLRQVKELNDHYRCSVYAVNILDLKGLTSNDRCGLYRIGAMASHASVYLMWLDDGKKYFIDCERNLSETLREIFALWKDSKCRMSDSDKLTCIERIISTFDNNQPDSNELEPNAIMTD